MHQASDLSIAKARGAFRGVSSRSSSLSIRCFGSSRMCKMQTFSVCVRTKLRAARWAETFQIQPRSGARKSPRRKPWVERKKSKPRRQGRKEKEATTQAPHGRRGYHSPLYDERCRDPVAPVVERRANCLANRAHTAYHKLCVRPNRS